MRLRLMESLKDGKLLFDGATGTYLKSRPGLGECPPETACLTAPEEVAALHRAYLLAGSRLIKTNTFAAYPGLAAEDAAMQEAIIRAAVRIAMTEAQRFDAVVFGDIGPAPDEEDAAQAYIRMAERLHEAGVRAFLFETMPSDEGIDAAVRHIRSLDPDAFIAVSFAADPDGFTRAGVRAGELLARMEQHDDVDAVGLNCICGAYHLRRLMERLPKGRKLRIAMPNAGYPHMVDGRMFYDSDPQYYAHQTVRCGADIVGGCCGTTPEHIRAIAERLARGSGAKTLRTKDAQDEEKRCRSRLLQALSCGERPVLVELDPPVNAKIDAFLSGAQEIIRAGADAITIADCPIGRARMDASLLACKLHRELGVETMPHMTCRDRNVNATKALLLGLSMEGVHNVLAVTGDPVPSGDRGSVKGVFQFHSRMLARFVRSLVEAGEADPFFLCGALNINAQNFDAELEKAKDKEAAGVVAFLTQPVLSARAAENLRRARRELDGYLFAGLFPVVSYKNALFMANEVSGVRIDSGVLSAYEGLSREQGEALALRLCMDAARAVQDACDGYYVMTPFSRTQLVARIVTQLRQL